MIYGDVSYDSLGFFFIIKKFGEVLIMQFEFYFFFGIVFVVVKVVKGIGIVSCVILEFDDLDEIDWEWFGGSVD